MNNLCGGGYSPKQKNASLASSENNQNIWEVKLIISRDNTAETLPPVPQWHADDVFRPGTTHTPDLKVTDGRAHNTRVHNVQENNQIEKEGEVDGEEQRGFVWGAERNANKTKTWMCWCGFVPREPDSYSNYIRVQIFWATESDSFSPVTQNIWSTFP